MLKQREIDLSAVCDKRLEHLWNKKQAEKDRQIKQLRAKHIKALRKLNEKRKNVEGKLQRRDIISDYANYGSQAYAPKTRLGQFLDISSEKYQVKSKHLDTYTGLVELESSLPYSSLQPHTKPPKRESAISMGSKASREERRIKVQHFTIVTIGFFFTLSHSFFGLHFNNSFIFVEYFAISIYNLIKYEI